MLVFSFLFEIQMDIYLFHVLLEKVAKCPLKRVPFDSQNN